MLSRNHVKPTSENHNIGYFFKSNKFVSDLDIIPFMELNYIFLDEKECLTLDNLNLYYVAFTRAQDRLYVSMDSPKTNIKTNIKHYITDEIMNHHEFDPDTKRLIIGKEKKLVLKEESPRHQLDIKLKVDSWKEHIHISYNNQRSKSNTSEEQFFGIPRWSEFRFIRNSDG